MKPKSSLCQNRSRAEHEDLVTPEIQNIRYLYRAFTQDCETINTTPDSAWINCRTRSRIMWICERQEDTEIPLCVCCGTAADGWKIIQVTIRLGTDKRDVL